MRKRPTAVVVGALAAISLLASACQSSAPPAGGGQGGSVTGVSGGVPGGGTSGPQTSPPKPKSTAHLRITPVNGKQAALPESGITVSATGGKITKVKVKSGGDPVTGHVDQAHTTWQSDWALQTSTKYTVRATAVDGKGLKVTKTSTFQTLTPTDSFRTVIFEGYQKTYGVGMPIILTFDKPIENKEALERSLVLQTSKPVVGAWYWDGDSTLMFRPRGYWPDHTTVRFTGHLDGVLGSPGVYGVHTLTQTFNIGRSLVAVASTQDHHMEVYLDHKLLGDWPISTGKPGDETANGTYLSITKANPEEMIGDDYDILVPFSVRITWSGAFVHAAPWSLGEQGRVNVSHGCVNLSPTNAETYYNLSVPGDPVTVTGSPRPGEWDNGWTVWFLSWKDLLDGTATHQVVRANSKGSTFVDPSSLHQVTIHSPLGGPRPNNSVAV
jgi:lipoprotein-anchoring transpeptidase ErfK/SrfK